MQEQETPTTPTTTTPINTMTDLREEALRLGLGDDLKSSAAASHVTDIISRASDELKDGLASVGLYGLLALSIWEPAPEPVGQTAGQEQEQGAIHHSD